MNSTVIDRRALVLGTLAFIGASSLRSGLAMAGAEVAYVATAGLADGSFGVVLLRGDGSIATPFSSKKALVPSCRPMRTIGTGFSPDENTIGK